MAKKDASAAVVLSNGIEKSFSDDREYRHVELPNQLHVTLVSDATADYASAALCVKVGQFSDPDHVPGLAHFCEHMLFLGTEKYPDENSYSAYLNKHGGMSNAYTASEDTNYFFEVQHAYLEEALDRFAQFFIGPLFTESCVSRELNAVNSENTKNLQNDHWRMYQLSRSTARPGHPYNKFGTGNLETLKDTPEAEGIDVRAELLKFHETYYSANQMRLCVVGRNSLDELEGWVTSMFAAIKNTGRDAPKFATDCFGPDQTQMFARVVPVRDLREVKFEWAMPSGQPLYRTKPSSYISHLIGHEGPGSLLSLLKKRNLATELMAGPSESDSSFSLFTVSITLTPAGLEAVEEVVAATLQYVAMLRREGPKRWIWEECQATAAMSFRYKSKERPGRYATTVSRQMHVHPVEHYLTGPRLLYDYDDKAITSFLNCLTVEGMRVVVVDMGFEGHTDKTERWYQTPYSSDRFTPAQVAKWTSKLGFNDDLHLPAKNEFIATDFTIRVADAAAPAATDAGTGTTGAGAGAGAGGDGAAAGAAAAGVTGTILGLPVPEVITPSVVRDDALARVWFKADTKFRRPKLSFAARILAPLATQSPRNLVLSKVYARVVSEALNEFAYSASIANLNYELVSTNRGMRLEVSGFNHKLPVLLGKLAEKMVNVEFTEEEFERMRDLHEKALRNIAMHQPYQHCIQHLQLMTELPSWNWRQQLAEVATVTADELRAFIPRLLSQVYVEALVHGNATADDALELMNRTLAPFEAAGTKGLHPSQHLDSRVVALPAGVEFVHSDVVSNADEENSAVEVYFQVGPYNPTVQAALSVLANIMREPAFDQLRTKEQLGYIVHSSTKSQHGVNGLRVIVQSSVKGPAGLDERVEAFLANFRVRLKAITADELAANMGAVAAKLLEIPKRPSDVAANMWYEIDLNRYNFGRRQEMAAAIERLKLDDVVAFFDQYIARGGLSRRKLAAHMISAKHQALEGDESKAEVVEMNGGSTATSSVKAGVTVQRPATQPGHLSLHEGLDLAASLAMSKPGQCADLEAVRSRLGLGPLLNPVADVSDMDAFRSSLPLHAVSGRWTRGSSFASRL